MSSEIYFFRIEKGNNPIEELKRIARENKIFFGLVSGIGGFSKARIAVYSVETNTYHYIDVEPLEGHVLEVLSLQGNVVVNSEGEAFPHIHVVLAKSPREIYGGHLVEATVNPFLELFIVDASKLAGKARTLLAHRWRLKPLYEKLQ